MSSIKSAIKTVWLYFFGPDWSESKASCDE